MIDLNIAALWIGKILIYGAMIASIGGIIAIVAYAWIFGTNKLLSAYGGWDTFLKYRTWYQTRSEYVLFRGEHSLVHCDLCGEHIGYTTDCINDIKIICQNCITELEINTPNKES